LGSRDHKLAEAQKVKRGARNILAVYLSQLLEWRFEIHRQTQSAGKAACSFLGKGEEAMKILKADPEEHSIVFCIYCIGEQFIDQQQEGVIDASVLKIAEQDFLKKYEEGSAFFSVDHDDDDKLDLEIVWSKVLEKAEIVEGIPVGPCWIMKVGIPDEQMFSRLQAAQGVSMQGRGMYEEDQK